MLQILGQTDKLKDALTQIRAKAKYVKIEIDVMKLKLNCLIKQVQRQKFNSVFLLKNICC